MSGMIVHGIPGSPYVRAALLSLEEKGAAYEFAAMALGTLKQQPHLARHPFGRIPAFEHDGWMLYETQAIMRYVDAVVPGPRLQPEEPRAIARNRVVAPRFNRPVDEDEIVKAIPNARICIAEIGRLLDGHSWMAGAALSLADLLLAPHLSMFAQAPEGAQILQEHENLSRWLARIEARPSMQATTWDRLLERVAAAA